MYSLFDAHRLGNLPPPYETKLGRTYAYPNTEASKVKTPLAPLNDWLKIPKKPLNGEQVALTSYYREREHERRHKEISTRHDILTLKRETTDQLLQNFFRDREVQNSLRGNYTPPKDDTLDKIILKANKEATVNQLPAPSNLPLQAQVGSPVRMVTAGGRLQGPAAHGQVEAAVAQQLGRDPSEPLFSPRTLLSPTRLQLGHGSVTTLQDLEDVDEGGGGGGGGGGGSGGEHPFGTGAAVGAAPRADQLAGQSRLVLEDTRKKFLAARQKLSSESMAAGSATSKTAIKQQLITLAENYGIVLTQSEKDASFAHVNSAIERALNLPHQVQKRTGLQ